LLLVLAYIIFFVQCERLEELGEDVGGIYISQDKQNIGTFGTKNGVNFFGQRPDITRDFLCKSQSSKCLGYEYCTLANIFYF